MLTYDDWLNEPERIKERKTTKLRDIRYKKIKDSYQRPAHKAVRRAIKKGLLVRPSVCETCRKECKPLAHHTNYDRLLDVMWLCYKCHQTAPYDPAWFIKRQTLYASLYRKDLKCQQNVRKPL